MPGGASDNAVGLELTEGRELPSIVGDDPHHERGDDRSDGGIRDDNESRVRAEVHGSGRLRRGRLQHLQCTDAPPQDLVTHRRKMQRDKQQRERHIVLDQRPMS